MADVRQESEPSGPEGAPPRAEESVEAEGGAGSPSNSEDSSSSTSSSSSSSDDFGLPPVTSLDCGKQMVTKSLCMQCGAQGTTRLLFADIPKFGETVISSFRCRNCGFSGRDVSQAAEIQDQGIRVSLGVRSAADLSRGVVKSSTCTLRIPEVDLTIDPRPMSGYYTTVEGVVRKAIDDLSSLQPERRARYPEQAQKIDEFLVRLQRLLDVGGASVAAGASVLGAEGVASVEGAPSIHSIPSVSPAPSAAAESDPADLKPKWTIVLDDPSGNSRLEPLLGDLDRFFVEERYNRTSAQSAALGLTDAQEKVITRQRGTAVVDERKLDDLAALLDEPVPAAAPGASGETPAAEGTSDVPPDYQYADVNSVVRLKTACPACGKEVESRSLIIHIPYFRECLLMCLSCDACGFRNVEVQSAGGVSPFGRRTVLRVTDPSDLSRDVLKSDSCRIKIPDLEIELQPGTLGGVFTTLEGLMRIIHDELKKHSVFWIGDGAPDDEQQQRWTEVLSGLDAMASGERNFTIEIDDPLDSSFIKNVFAPDPDPNMEIETYARSAEQNAEFGFDQMDTEKYEA